ncbi:hypothetical protein Ddc_24572 [Ditylenchus destructor]|nr:hypothetical protein Ddc_24572 [Ditylenchus destructor]
MDNGTMVEAFKSLNYCQLAKSSLVSKRYRNLIRTHRHSLAVLDVQYIGMDCYSVGFPIHFKIYDEELSPEEYNEWIDRNGYSSQIPETNQRYGKVYDEYTRFLGYKLWRNKKYDDGRYGMRAFADYKDSNGSRSVFDAMTEFNHENWPAFQHFIRLMTDPSVYIRSLKLVPLYELFNLLTGAMNSDHNRLQCGEIGLCHSYDLPKFIKFVKEHASCDKLCVNGDMERSYDCEFREFLTTGAKCTSEIRVEWSNLLKVAVVFVQKFLDLKSCDENQLVESISFSVKDLKVEAVKRCYAEFFVKQVRREDGDGTELVFEIDNRHVGKKLQLKVTTFDERYGLKFHSRVSLKIANL